MSRGDRRLLWMAILSLGGAVSVAVTSVILGTRVRYTDHLMLFNVFAAVMLGLGVSGLALSLAGTWRTRFGSRLFSITGAASLLFLIRLMVDK